MKPVEGEREDGKEGGEAVPPPVPVPMLLRPPVEMGKVLFENVDFGVDLETRIGREGGREGGEERSVFAEKLDCVCAHSHFSLPFSLLHAGIVGANGAGKSTLLNLILDKLRPTEGHIFRHHNLRLASFTQHHGDQFDLRLSAVENFEAMFPKSDQQVCSCTHFPSFLYLSSSRVERFSRSIHISFSPPSLPPSLLSLGIAESGGQVRSVWQ